MAFLGLDKLLTTELGLGGLIVSVLLAVMVFGIWQVTKLVLLVIKTRENQLTEANKSKDQQVILFSETISEQDEKWRCEIKDRDEVWCKQLKEEREIDRIERRENAEMVTEAIRRAILEVGGKGADLR